MLSESSHQMRLKLVYCAFSSSPSKDSMSIFWGLLSLFVEVEAFCWFFSFQNLIATPSIVIICGCINKDVSQAILALFSVPSLKYGRVGRVSRFLFRFLSMFQPFKMWRPLSLLILAQRVKSHYIRERNVSLNNQNWEMHYLFTV